MRAIALGRVNGPEAIPMFVSLSSNCDCLSSISRCLVYLLSRVWMGSLRLQQTSQAVTPPPSFPCTLHPFSSHRKSAPNGTTPLPSRCSACSYWGMDSVPPRPWPMEALFPSCPVRRQRHMHREHGEHLTITRKAPRHAPESPFSRSQSRARAGISSPGGSQSLLILAGVPCLFLHN